ncbi:hypothetical protein [Streptomyces phaeoluteigriseus]
MAAHPAREHGGSARSWQRAMNEARAQYKHEHRQDHDGPDDTGPAPHPAH